EDGIRYFHVTGVQTCALPICLPAIELGDRDVHQDQVGQVFPRAAHTLFTVAGFDDRVADMFEDSPVDDEVVLIVLDQKDRLSRVAHVRLAPRGCSISRGKADRMLHVSCHFQSQPAAASASSRSLKTFRFVEWPGLYRAFGSISCTAWLTAMAASLKPVAISSSLPSYVQMSPAAYTRGRFVSRR